MIVLCIITDENIDDSIVAFLVERRHEVYRVREKFGAGTPDHIIANVASELGAIVMMSDNHFRRLAGWSSARNVIRYPNMSLILVPGDTTATMLVEAYIEDIETNYSHAQAFDDKRLLIDINTGGFFVRRTL